MSTATFWLLKTKTNVPCSFASTLIVFVFTSSTSTCLPKGVLLGFHLDIPHKRTSIGALPLPGTFFSVFPPLHYPPPFRRPSTSFQSVLHPSWIPPRSEKQTARKQVTHEKNASKCPPVQSTSVTAPSAPSARPLRRCSRSVSAGFPLLRGTRLSPSLLYILEHPAFYAAPAQTRSLRDAWRVPFRNRPPFPHTTTPAVLDHLLPGIAAPDAS